MLKQPPTRQRIRKALVIFAFLSFPVTMNFLSPYVIIDGAREGIINGSLVMFGLMFVSSLFLGRAWCGWVCPGGGMQEIVQPVNNQTVRGYRMDWIKWTIWIPWVSLILWLAVRAGGFSSLNMLHLTESGISVDEPVKYITYYVVIGLFVGLAVLIGRRAGCHAICWMAPFMILGNRVRNHFGWASLRLTADASICNDCKKCVKHCLMSLDVNGMVRKQQMEHPECILCGTCVDNCPQNAIRYSFSADR